jgi:hypothetical protein
MPTTFIESIFMEHKISLTASWGAEYNLID